MLSDRASGAFAYLFWGNKRSFKNKIFFFFTVFNLLSISAVPKWLSQTHSFLAGLRKGEFFSRGFVWQESLTAALGRWIALLYLNWQARVWGRLREILIKKPEPFVTRVNSDLILPSATRAIHGFSFPRILNWINLKSERALLNHQALNALFFSKNLLSYYRFPCL